MLEYLTRAQAAILSGDGTNAVTELIEMLRRELTAAEPKAWKRAVLSYRAHPILQLLHQDPFTHRAWSKPRGYPGDAVMLDYMYRAELPSETTQIGRSVYEATTANSSSLSVIGRMRRLTTVIGQTLDELAIGDQRKLRFLSVAAGHLREIEGIDLARFELVQDWLAVDQDAESLAEIERCYARLGVRTVLDSIGSLINSDELGRFDLIYASGVFDYLNTDLAQLLLKALFAKLRGNGRLIIANFAPNNYGRGYIEAFMDWWLIYRVEKEVDDLSALIHQHEILAKRMFRDEQDNMIWLELMKVA